MLQGSQNGLRSVCGGKSLKTRALNCFCTVLGSDICPNIWFLYHFHLKSKLDFLSKQAANSSL